MIAAASGCKMMPEKLMIVLVNANDEPADFSVDKSREIGNAMTCVLVANPAM